MPPSSPRDTLAFPLAAALWAAAGSIATTLVNLALTLRSVMGDGATPDVFLGLLPSLVGENLLGMIVLAALVFLVAERRQARAPERIGHGPGAAAVTGLVAAIGAWIAVSVAAALAYSQFALLQSPTGFAIVGAAMSLLHLGVAAFGASVGAVLRPQAGDAPNPPTPHRHARAGVVVFGAALAFGIDLVIGLLPGLLQDTVGTGLWEATQWSALSALLIGAVVALGYAWRRGGTTAALAWSGDVWAALAVLPIALVVSAGVGALALAITYLMSDGILPFLGVAGVGTLLIAGIAFSGLGALAGLVRTRKAPRRG